MPHTAAIEQLFVCFARVSVDAIVLIVLALGLRMALPRRLAPNVLCLIWLVIGLRLIVPIGIASSWMPATLVANAVAKPTVAASTETANASYETLVDVSVPIQRITTISTPDVSPVVSRSTFRLTTTLAWVWLCGAAVLLLVALVRRWLTHRLVAQMPIITDHFDRKILTHCRDQFGLKGEVEVRESRAIRSPAVWGFRRMVLIVPADLELSASQLRMCLLHEFAHVRRRDVWLDAAADVVRAIHWFNPFVWIAASAFRNDRELACDANVLSTLPPAENVDYAACLLRVVEHMLPVRRGSVAIEMFGRKASLQRRLRMIVDDTAFRSRNTLTGALSFSLLLCGALFTSAAAGADEPTDSPPSTRPTPAFVQILNDPDAEMDARLRQRIETLTLDHQPLDAALRSFEAQGVNIQVDWKILETSGVKRDTPISLTLKDVEIRKALQVMLDACTDKRGVLTFGIDRGNVLVTRHGQLKVSTRVYDIRDLLAPAPTDEERDAIIEQMITFVTSTVSKDSWKTHGGLTGAIQELGGQLIITQTPDQHRAIAELLGQLRGHQPAEILIEATFITMPRDALSDDVRQSLGDERVSMKGIILTDEQAAALRKGAGKHVLAAPRLRLSDKQRASVRVGTKIQYTATFKRLESPGAPVGYEPMIGVVDEGIMMECDATHSADRKSITVEIKPTLTRLDRMVEVPFADVPTLKIQKPELDVQTISTTLSMPAGATALLQGVPLKKDPSQMFYILLTPTLVAPEAPAK